MTYTLYIEVKKFNKYADAVDYAELIADADTKTIIKKVEE